MLSPASLLKTLATVASDTANSLLGGQGLPTSPASSLVELISDEHGIYSTVVVYMEHREGEERGGR